MITSGLGSRSKTIGSVSHGKSYQRRQKCRWTSCHFWNYSEILLSKLAKLTSSKSKSKSRLRPSMVTLSLLLIAALILESSMVSCLPVIPANQPENPSSTSQVPPKHLHHSQHHAHHHRHHHQRERAKHHQPKHFQESLEAVDTSGSLSIVTPLDVLRQNMLLEMARKRHRDAKSKQVKFNTEFLERIG